MGTALLGFSPSSAARHHCCAPGSRDTVEIPDYEPTPERIKKTMLAFIQQVDAMLIGIHVLHGCCYLGSLADKGSKFTCDLLIVAACRPRGHAPGAVSAPVSWNNRMAAAISNADRRGLVTSGGRSVEKPTRYTMGAKPVSKNSIYLRLVRKKASARPPPWNRRKRMLKDPVVPSSLACS